MEDSGVPRATRSEQLDAPGTALAAVQNQIDRLTAITQYVAGALWEPIETAPRGGSRCEILVYSADGIFTAFWSIDKECFVEATEGAPFGGHDNWLPCTHWMPLPGAPK